MSNLRVDRRLRLVWVGGCALLAAFSIWIGFERALHFAASRIYDVAECQNVHGGAALAAGRAVEFDPGASLYWLPLGWIANSNQNSADLFAYGRLVSVGFFWINLLLLPLATGERLGSARGLVALLGAGTLAPLWLEGLEIRVENVVLTGLLLSWCVLRVGRAGVKSFVIAGALAAALLFTQFHSVAFTLPIALACLAFPQSGNNVPRPRLAAAWLGGGVGMCLLIWLLFQRAGIPMGVPMGSGAYGAGYFTGLGDTLGRLAVQTPLVATLALAGILDVVRQWRGGDRSVLSWKSDFAETVAVLVAFAALLVTPSPEPSFLVILVAFSYLSAFRYGARILGEHWSQSGLKPVAISVLVFAHVVPFIIAVHERPDRSVFRQEQLMRLAEDVTDRTKDRIGGEAGLVPMRQGVGYDILARRAGSRSADGSAIPSVRELLAMHPTPVILTSFRTDRWQKSDHSFILSNYVAVSDEFWVLGTVLPPGGGTFEILHPGRYRISTLEGSDLAGTYLAGLERSPEVPGSLSCTLNGVPFSNRPVELTSGLHRLETDTNVQPAIVWVGPRRDRLHRQGVGDHLQLFRVPR